MKLSALLALTLSFNFLLSFPAQAVSFEKIEVRLQKHAIDPEQLSEILDKHPPDWQKLTPKEKEIAVKGSIINLDMEDDDTLLEQHTQSAIQCMDSKKHGLNLPYGEDINLPLVWCITDAYKK